MGEDAEPEIVAYADSMHPGRSGAVSRQTIKAELAGWAKKVLRSRKVFRAGFDLPSMDSNKVSRRFFLVAPIYSMNKALGALAVLEDGKVVMNDEDLDLLQSLADQAGLAVENANLRENAEEMAVVAERNRIARDLHDAITQTLFSANLIAESLPQVMKKNMKEGARNLHDLQKLNKGALSEMRTLLLELRPNVIPDIKLEDLIRQMGEAVEGRAGLHVLLDIKESVRLPEKVHLQFYRIAQEAVANIIKHAHAKKMTVKFHSKSYRRNGQGYIKARMLIEDDGVGFEPDVIQGIHFGLRDIRERADSIAAQMKLTSILGKGTTLELEWKGREFHQDEEC
jgi:signal transduction histidine kinase